MRATKTRVECDEFGDWRIQAASRLASDLPAAYPGGPAHKAGTPVYLTSVVSTKERSNFAFITPNAAALALNASFNSADTASQLVSQLNYRMVPTPSGSGIVLESQCSPLLFDYFSFAMVAAESAFQGLEAFTNEIIARHLKEAMTFPRRRGTEILGAEEIERRISTEEKIGTVLPRLFGEESLKGSAIWEKFKILKSVRDGAVHFKSGDQYPLGGRLSEDSLYALLLNNEPRSFPIIALTLLWRLNGTKATPRWLSHLVEKYGIEGAARD